MNAVVTSPCNMESRLFSHLYLTSYPTQILWEGYRLPCLVCLVRTLSYAHHYTQTARRSRAASNHAWFSPPAFKSRSCTGLIYAFYIQYVYRISCLQCFSRPTFCSWIPLRLPLPRCRLTYTPTFGPTVAQTNSLSNRLGPFYTAYLVIPNGAARSRGITRHPDARSIASHLYCPSRWLSVPE